MTFASLGFLGAFLPLTLATFWLTCRYRPSLAAPVLLLAAIAFCLLNQPLALVLLSASVVGNYGLMQWILHHRNGSWMRRGLTAAGIVLNIAPLAAYKIATADGAGFFNLSTGHGIVIPLGLAFYSLQQVTFLLDAQKTDTTRLDFPRYAAWSSLFAQLAAGPIAPYRQMAPQYERLGLEMPSRWTIIRGLTLLLAGLVKKLVLADPLGRTVNMIYGGALTASATPLDVAAAAWGFLLQIYFDFSAYSDMAIGIGLCLGLRLPVNFNSPLKATSAGDYILRWHISLSLFVRDYVFQPFFRLMRNLPIQPTATRYTVAWGAATTLSYIAIGAWHTASPVVLTEAAAVGLIVVSLQVARIARPSWPAAITVPPRLMRLTGQVLLLTFASVAALFLRADSAQHLSDLFHALTDFPALGHLALRAARTPIDMLTGGGHVARHIRLFAASDVSSAWALLILGGTSLIAWTCPNTMELFGFIRPKPSSVGAAWIWRPSLRWGLATGVMIALALSGLAAATTYQGFIYAGL